jgi:hypothetical protein
MEVGSMRVLLTALLLASALAVFALPSVSGFVGSAYACEEPARGNNGWGNGDQNAPGNSETHNGAENNPGNGNHMGDAPGNSGH